MPTATVDNEKDARARRHIFTGVVVSDKADKTRVVSVQRQVRHPKYEKVIRKRSRFYVHDEANESRLGDLVEVMGTRPLSKLKRWRLVRVVKAAPRVSLETPAEGGKA
ncbi:MAG TPA: 30S ribosomal protein S17 [Elusimicrobiota bacterium]|jgi:small subunit ribosomal protein S17|nr:30S ribosomal protein S17 [Elusimicrobiota bacterium]